MNPLINKPVVFTKDMVEKNKYLATLADGVNITFQSIADKMNEVEKMALGNPRPLFKTLIKIITKIPGQPDKVSLEANTCVLSGRLRTLEASFGLRPVKEQHLSLNDLLQIPHSLNIFSEANEEYKNLKVLAFCIGDGARNAQNVQQEFKATNCETKMYNIVPLRCVEENSDLSAEEAYHAAVFEGNPVISCVNNNETAVNKFNIKPVIVLSNEAEVTSVEKNNAG